MKCIGQKKTGEPCARSATAGQWCTEHIHKVRKYYETYKLVEQSIECLQTDMIDITTYTHVQLTTQITKLLKAYHYRTTLRKFVYPDYHDDGHTQRIAKIVELIGKLSQRVSELERDTVDNLFTHESTHLSSTQSQPRPAQATSQKGRQSRKRTVAQVQNPSRNSKDLNNMFVFVHETEMSYINILLLILDRYFADKFGADGPIIQNVALSCAYTVADTMVTQAKGATRLPELKLKAKQRLVNPSSELVLQTTTRCGVKVINFAGRLQHHLRNYCVDKRGVFYAIYTIVQSFRIDISTIHRQLRNEGVIPPWLISIFQRDQKSMIEIRTAFSLEVEQGVPDFFLKFPEALKIQHHLIQLRQKDSFKSVPQLDIGFCIAIGKLYKLNAFCCQAELNGQLIFYTPFLKSQPIDLAAISGLEEFQHGIGFDRKLYYKYLETRFPEMTEYHKNIGSLLVS